MCMCAESRVILSDSSFPLHYISLHYQTYHSSLVSMILSRFIHEAGDIMTQFSEGRALPDILYPVARTVCWSVGCIPLVSRDGLPSYLPSSFGLRDSSERKTKQLSTSVMSTALMAGSRMTPIVNTSNICSNTNTNTIGITNINNGCTSCIDVSGTIAVKNEDGQYMTVTHSDGLVFETPQDKDYAAFLVHPVGGGKIRLQGLHYPVAVPACFFVC